MRKIKRILVSVLVLIMLFTLTACGDDKPKPTPSATNQPSNGNDEGKAPTIDPVNGSYVQQPSYKDYTYMWWRDGFNKGRSQMNFQTGYYGLAVDTSKASISYLGPIENAVTEAEAGKQDTSVIENLPKTKMSYSIVKDGVESKFKRMEGVGGNGINSRILESGHYMQRIEVMYLLFENQDDLKGRLEIAAMPEYFAMEFSVFSNTKVDSMDLNFTLTLDDSYVNFTPGLNGRSLTATQENGHGLTFILPQVEGASLAVDGKTITFSCKGMEIRRYRFTGFGVIVIPSTKASEKNAINYTYIEQTQVSAVQIHPKEGKEQGVEFDTNKGYVSISANSMLTYRTTDFNVEKRQDEYDRLKFTLTNNSNETVKVPIQFYKTGNFGVEGMAPFLRDANTGEPIGVPVQLTKNWHAYSTNKNDFNYAATNDPKRSWSDTWFHGYTVIEVPAGQTVSYEFCITYAKWGGVFASSHAQLCLSGWGGNYQQWETSAIGSFGESFCYDPETAHGRSFIDDIRPLTVYSMGGKYGWTACNGGGNFLIYGSTTEVPMAFKQVKTWFKKQGPNLTEVVYTGVTLDGKIQFEITANLPRTNDASRVYHTFKYTFLQDTTFRRMAFYQFGADNYNDNRWDTMVVGDDNGPASFTIGGTTYAGEFETPTANYEGYIGGKMQRITLEGDGLWFVFNKAVALPHKSGPAANRMLNVISYNANLNGKTYTKPSFNLRYTTNYNMPCLLTELTVPEEVGNKIEAGSVVEGVVEYINLPVEKSDYYGPSPVMNGIPAEDFNTYKIAYTYAKGGKYTVSASVGTVIKNTPIYVEGVKEDTVAQIAIKGGIGYVPITFTNVPTYSGYRLEKKVGDAWEMVDQSVNGNDYWQAYYDANKGTFELTFNVEHNGDPEAVYEYRLVKKS